VSKNQIWPGDFIGCDCGCQEAGDGPDEDGTPYYGGVTDDYNSISYPWNQPERDYWTEEKDRKAEES
jgi:hypothetical protein